jgi:hypothetical protein
LGEVLFAGGDPPRDDAVARWVQIEMQGWRPSRGTDWADLMRRSAARRSPALVLAVSSFAQVAILVVAVVAMTALHLGPLAT